MLLAELGKRCQPVTAGSEWFQVLFLGLGLGQFQWLCKHFFFFFQLFFSLATVQKDLLQTEEENGQKSWLFQKNQGGGQAQRPIKYPGKDVYRSLSTPLLAGRC